MDFLYIEYKDKDGVVNRLRLTATVSVTHSQAGVSSEYAVEDGTTSSDHYSQKPDTIKFQGQISQFTFFRPAQNPDGTLKTSAPLPTTLPDYEILMTKLKKSGKYFTCSFSRNLNPMKKCLFSSLNITRSTETGLHALDIDFTIKQTTTALQAGVVATPVPADQYKDMVEEKDKGSGSTTGGSKKCKAEQRAVEAGIRGAEGISAICRAVGL